VSWGKNGFHENKEGGAEGSQHRPRIVTKAVSFTENGKDAGVSNAE
jgi:hypothetical protein